MAQVAPAAVPANAPKEATITPFTPNDDKVVKFIVGKTALEALAAANQKGASRAPAAQGARWNADAHSVLAPRDARRLRRALVHPRRVPPPVAESTAWLGRVPPSAAHLLRYGPPDHLPRGLVRGTITSSKCALSLLRSIQRDAFEADAQARLKAPDVQALRATYGAPPSGLWLLRLGERFLGLVALDASAAASGTVHVRHLFADEQYRAAHAQDDLLEFALRRAFAEKKIHAVRLSWDPLRSYVGDAAKRVGFHTVPDGASLPHCSLAATYILFTAPPSKPIGLLRWRRQELEITRKDFERRTGAASDTADSSRTL
jgi:hypothetical protein